MATHIKFKRKEFSVGSKIVTTAKKNPLATATLVVSSSNLATNLSRHHRDRKYQDKQIEAMDRLTNSLTKVNKTMNGNNNLPNTDNKKQPIFASLKRQLTSK